MTAVGTETVLSVRHWTDTQFSFRTTRDRGLRFENGQFLMLGLAGGARPLLRAYSIASANHEEHLEFLSIKVPGGPLTSRLQHLRPGDQVLVSRKPTGSLLLADVRAGAHLYLLSTGTGAAPFLSLIKDPELYERFARIVFVHGVRWARESEMVRGRIAELARDEWLGPAVGAQLSYFPAVTREGHAARTRITGLLDSGRLTAEVGLPALSPRADRFMICGNPTMLTDVSAGLIARGFEPSARVGEAGDFVIERAFVNK